MNNESIWALGTFGRTATNLAEQAEATPQAEYAAEQAERQTIDIYRAVLRRLFGLHCLSGTGPLKPFLFILYSEARSSNRPAFSERERRGISAGSLDLPVRIVWVEDVYGVSGDPAGEYVPSDGAVVQFDGCRRESGDFVQVRGRIRRAGKEPRNFEYSVEKKQGFWLVKSSYIQWAS
jgi:hypothetical protein